MNKMFIMAFINLKRMFKDKKMILGIFLAPIVVVGILCMLSQSGDKNDEKISNKNRSNIKIDIVNYDKGDLSKEIINLLQADPSVIVNHSTEEEAFDNIDNKNSDIAFVIPKAFTEKANTSSRDKIKVLKLKDSPVYPQIEMVNSFIKGDKGGKKVYMNIGVLLNFVINFIMYSMIYIIQEIHDLREWNILNRSFSTPNSGKTILGGLLLAIFVLLILQFGALNLLTLIILKRPINENIIGSTMLFLPFSILVLSIGLLVARVLKNSSLSSVIVNLIVVPTGVISGTFFPKAFLPEYLKKISFISPQYWISDGFQKLDSSGIASILPNVGILLLMAACFFIVGTLNFEKLIVKE